MGRRLVALALIGTILAGGCTRFPDASRRHARVGDRTLSMLVAGADGMRGMSSFDGADGMLFDFAREVDPTAVSFVMDGVAFPMDIAWFDARGALVGSAPMTICTAEPCPHYEAPGPYRWAIEAPAGSFADLSATARLVVGD